MNVFTAVQHVRVLARLRQGLPLYAQSLAIGGCRIAAACGDWRFDDDISHSDGNINYREWDNNFVPMLNYRSRRNSGTSRHDCWAC